MRGTLPALFGFGGSEGIEGPDVLNLVVPENVEVSIHCANAEVDRIRLVPLVLNGDDLKRFTANLEPIRALVGAVACVTFDLDGGHEPSVRRESVPGRRSTSRVIRRVTRTERRSQGGRTHSTCIPPGDGRAFISGFQGFDFRLSPRWPVRRIARTIRNCAARRHSRSRKRHCRRRRSSPPTRRNTSRPAGR